MKFTAALLPRAILRAASGVLHPWRGRIPNDRSPGFATVTPPHDVRVKRAAFAVLVAALLVSCARAAAVFLDLPPKQQPQPAAQMAGAPRVDTAARDTARPLIEATLDPDSVRKLLPRDADGNVDWMKALRDERIRPRPNLPGTPAPAASTFRFDFMYRGPDSMFDALFPHSSHVEWLRCESCHPTIFRYRNTPPTMDDVNAGRACGQCHGKVAFPTGSCWRCHTAMPAPEPDTEGGAAELLGTVTLARRPDTAEAARRGAASFPPARFPHWVHRIRYRCGACHPSLFQTRAGGDTLTMAALSGGLACGRCHDGRAAFALLACNRCHVGP